MIGTRRIARQNCYGRDTSKKKRRFTTEVAEYTEDKGIKNAGWSLRGVKGRGYAIHSVQRSLFILCGEYALNLLLASRYLSGNFKLGKPGVRVNLTMYKLSRQIQKSPTITCRALI
ncbi:MAG: hypothetical protein ACI88A_003420 [Paraglaciecola sp.]|jgi:hypothetical protein